MPGSRLGESCPRLAAPRRRRSGGEDRLGRRKQLAEQEAAAGGGEEGGVGRGLPAGEAAVRGAAEPCLHKTPKRSLSRKSRIPTFSSPVNDTDLQQEIFWDPHSPIARGLGKEKSKQLTSRRAVEISEIVNRIAPQDEKAACNEGSLLGTWIGEDAIPCTPGVVKVRARTKLCCTRDLKIKSPEEELMKLAKEFDKNLVELDAVHEQEKLSHGFIQTASQSLHNYKAELNINNLKSLLGDVSATGTALSLKPVGQSTGIPTVEPCQSSSQKSIDLEAEIALHALFDCSTQKCSGQLSQGLSSISLNNSLGESKSILEVEHLPEHIKTVQNGRSSACQRETLQALGGVKQTVPKTDTHMLTKKNSLKTELVVSSKQAGGVKDDFDDWDTDFLADDSFVMQITQNPELINVEEAPPVPINPSVQDFSDASRTKERSNPNSVICLESTHKSNSFQFSPLRHPSKNTQSVAKSLSLQKPCNKMENSKMASMDSAWSRAPNNHFKCNPASVQSQVKNGNGTVEPKGKLVPLFPSRSKPCRPQTEKPGNNTSVIFCESSIVSTNAKPNDLIKAVHHVNTGHLNPAEVPEKYPVSSDDWNEPRFSNEVLDMFCESDSLWDVNCEDDELLYQVCDDIEKQTQNQDVKQGSERAKTVQGASVQSRSNADSGFAASEQGLLHHPLAQQGNAQQDGHLRDNSSRNFSRFTHGLSTTGHVANCKNVLSPLTVTSGTEVESKYMLSKNCHQVASEDARRSTSGKWYRSNSVPARETSSEASSANAVKTFSSKSLENQDLLCSTGKVPNNSSGNRMSLMPSKFKFRKTNSSQSAFHVEPENPGSHSGTGITLQGVEGSKNEVNGTLHSKTEGTTSPFKRHLSESDGLPTSVSVVEQKHRKCSQEEIERKKQEALARRKSRMQAFLKDALV
ncbi:ewing's tumor-associated antigen 1 [Cyrtonyx montezumae]|uniref:ewing's tumor-associated antigen 1 n=1 Tax=Cyrtonyx montezumae TaxID=9017 RepID=UPI0032D9EE5F